MYTLSVNMFHPGSCLYPYKFTNVRDLVINKYQNRSRTDEFQHGSGGKHFSEPSDPVIRATQKVKGIADCWRGDLLGDGEWRDTGAAASIAAMGVCHPPPCDVAMLMQNVPCGTAKGLSPADLQNERCAHDTLGQTFSSQQSRLMISQKLCREPQLSLG